MNNGAWDIAKGFERKEFLLVGFGRNFAFNA